MNESARILSTKKLRQHQKQFLLNAGMAVVEADFIKIKYLFPELSHINEYLVFTSQNAVSGILGNPGSAILRNKDCFCVGARTRSLLELNGFKVISFAESSSGLAADLIKNHRDKRFTFLSGNMRRDELPHQLAAAAVDCNEITVYETVLSPVKIKAFYDGILFFSPSSVDSYLTENDPGDRACFCIGGTTAKALSKFGVEAIIANQSTIESTIVKCINHYNQRQSPINKSTNQHLNKSTPEN